jgi:Protein of unknown function (DUF2927)
MFRSLVLATALGTLPTLAQTPQFDGVIADRLLDDADFYRLATCGAQPGGPCIGPTLRWSKPVVTLTVIPGDDPLPDGFAMPLIQAAVRAVDEVNRIGAGIRIQLLPTGPADITIRPTALTEGTVLTDTPGFSGNGIMGVGFLSVWSDPDDRITAAIILISTSITSADLTSVVLEEVTQSLGFLHDIEGPAYEAVSILSQTSNATTRIAGQDATLLRLHYPPN